MLGYLEILKVILYKSSFDDKQIEIDIDDSKKHGMLVSGGLDSAILLYLFIKNYPTLDLKIFTIPKYDGAKIHSANVVDHFNKKFNINLPSPIIVGDPTVHHRAQSMTAVKDIFENYDIDHLHIGINKNPEELNHLPGAPKRSAESADPKIVFPFYNLLKTHIVDILYQTGQDDLIGITHSCTEVDSGRCNKCWQCTERSWAFNQLDKIDYGTN